MDAHGAEMESQIACFSLRVCRQRRRTCVEPMTNSTCVLTETGDRLEKVETQASESSRTLLRL